VIDLALL